jgi:hypothetical protein
MTATAKAKPTPGPWVTERYGDDCGDMAGQPFVRAAGRYGSLCVAHVEEWGAPGNPESEANARLIAAAGTAGYECEAAGFDGQATIEALPDLLTGLRAAVARVQIANAEGNPILSAWLPDALAALARCRRTE